LNAEDIDVSSEEQIHANLVLRYEDIRAFMVGLKISLPEKPADVLEEMLKETKTSIRSGGNLEKKIQSLRLKVSSLEYFLFGLREALTGDHYPAITRILESSDNATLAAAFGTDPKG